MTGGRSFNFKIRQISFAGFFLFFTIAVHALQNNASNCPGPIKFYEEISCEPIQGNDGSGCPVRYNCDHWKNLSDNECLINRKKYKVNEILRDEDKNKCETCTCLPSGNWACTMPSCRPTIVIFPNSDENYLDCFEKTDVTQCCGTRRVCYEKGEKRLTCVVDGKTYLDGETFVPLNEPEKLCSCREGYTGENVEPFCISAKHTWCDSILYDASDIRAGCIPVYRYSQSPRKDCTRSFRCPNVNDAVIKGTAPSTFTTSELENPDMMCKFGNLTMQIGDELNQHVDFTSACVRCVCDVPPIPTCQTRSYRECNPVDHGGYPEEIAYKG